MELVASGETRKDRRQEDIRRQSMTMPFYHLRWPSWGFLGLAADTRGLDFLGWPLRVRAVWALRTLDRLRAARQSGPHGDGFTAFAFESNRALGSGYKQT